MTWNRPEYGVPKCPVCGHKPTIRNLFMPLWGHFCMTAAMNIYWSWQGFWSPNLKFAEGVISREASADQKAKAES